MIDRLEEEKQRLNQEWFGLRDRFNRARALRRSDEASKLLTQMQEKQIEVARVNKKIMEQHRADRESRALANIQQADKADGYERTPK
jgi:hypothetical protein